MKRASSNMLILLGAGGVVFACSASTGTGQQGKSGQASQTVGPSGGTVTADDGTAVIIPAGALDHDTTITIALNPSAPALTSAQSLATAHVFGPEGQMFLKPIQVTLAFENLPQNVPESAIVVYTAPQGSSAYVALPTQVADASHVTATTTHFSNMCPASPNGSASDGGSGSGGDSGPTTCAVPCLADATGGAPSFGYDCSASVGGHAYAADCTCDTSTNTGTCTCTVDGMTVSSPSNVSCGGTSNPYESACNFPCPSGGSGSSSGGSSSGGSDGSATCNFVCAADATAGDPNVGYDCPVSYAGHSYDLNCSCNTMTGAGSCTCAVDGTSNAPVSTSSCETPTGMGQVFQQACGIACTSGNGGSGSSSGGSSSGGDASAADATVDAASCGPPGSACASSSSCCTGICTNGACQ